MRVRVFLNVTEEDGRLAVFSRFGDEDGGVYRDGDTLRHVFTYDVDGDTVNGVLNRVFSDFNRGSSTFVGDDVYRERSLSVGDVVEVAGVRYSVAGVGFREVSR